MKKLDENRWIVDDGLHELAHFVFLVDAKKFCSEYPDKLWLSNGPIRCEWGLW